MPDVAELAALVDRLRQAQAALATSEKEVQAVAQRPEMLAQAVAVMGRLVKAQQERSAVVAELTSWSPLSCTATVIT